MKGSGGVEILLFSVLKEQVGTARLRLEVATPISGKELLDRLEANHPAVAAYRSVLRLAVNLEYVPETVMVEAGDEVALITPVSGG